MAVYIPEGFRLPTNEDYDDLVAGVAQEVKEQGDARQYLGLIRLERANAQKFSQNFLFPAAAHALSLEDGS